MCACASNKQTQPEDPPYAIMEYSGFPVNAPAETALRAHTHPPTHTPPSLDDL